MPAPLGELLVVALEQAVAAPMRTMRLANAGARVIKIEREEGDTARHYDKAAKGVSAYFAWLNRGKESIALDLKGKDDLALAERMIAKADVFVQNLAPGATVRLRSGAGSVLA
nr:CoA transferase [Roseomonas sp. KE0001]